MKQKIALHKAVIAVVGLGYVGLPLAVAFARKGFKVLGIDVAENRITKLQAKKSYITDIPSADVAAVVDKGRFEASTDFALLKSADVVIICVPTPIKKRYTPDVSYMVGACESIARHIRKGALVVLESTTYPGTTEELIQPILEKGGLKAGKDFNLAFSPERIDPGNKQFKVTDIPKVVGGLTPKCTALTVALYGKIIKHIHPVSSPRAAEMTKLLENTFRIVNIGWINEAAMMCHRLGINIWEVVDAAKTKPFGFMPFYPGLGVGGHCIPEDPLYLYWKARKYGFSSKFIKLSADLNHQMPNYAIGRVETLLKSKGKSLAKAKVLVVGVTYKKDVRDLRKSPPLRLLALLQDQCKVDYHDPMVPYLDITDLKMDSAALTPAGVKKYDIVIIAVDHTDVDYAMIARHAKMVFDVKNVYSQKPQKNIHVL
ncbi:MAG: nucleotide sugar dehydrogenase [Candidatus Omnitrophica bacterium]|nr:nucleotide sugar dehydrogenase [Candidatus Omnitrophota bacterium]